MREISPFLNARWQYLAMLNYETERSLLVPYVPPGTEVDTWNSKTFVSMVGFLFLETRILGLSVPLHRCFEEVNLRFYVRRKGIDGWRRGVVFIKEIVPKRTIATVARWVYGEKYVALPMRHSLQVDAESLEERHKVEYAWLHQGCWNRLGVSTVGAAALPEPGSDEEFITEHYWGYTAQRDGGCLEYRVEHPQWKVWQVSESYLTCDVTRFYGPEFVDSLSAVPSSAFLAEGSPVTVYKGKKVSF